MDGKFDACYIDIWASAYDLDTYLRAKSASRHLKDTKTMYWVEDTLLYTVSDILLNMMQSEYDGEPNKIIDYIQAVYDKVEIMSAEDVEHHLDIATINEMLSCSGVVYR